MVWLRVDPEEARQAAAERRRAAVHAGAGLQPEDLVHGCCPAAAVLAGANRWPQQCAPEAARLRCKHLRALRAMPRPAGGVERPAAHLGRLPALAAAGGAALAAGHPAAPGAQAAAHGRRRRRRRLAAAHAGALKVLLPWCVPHAPGRALALEGTRAACLHHRNGQCCCPAGMESSVGSNPQDHGGIGRLMLQRASCHGR